MLEPGLLGWVTGALVLLDDIEAGLLARVLTAAPQRRQAIFAAIATREIKAGVADVGSELFPPTFAEVVRHGRAMDILRHAYGEVPEGFLGLLERIGERPLPRAQDYRKLVEFLVDEDQRAADALRTAGRITCRKLEVVSALDPRWRHANTLDRIDTGVEALTFNSAVEFIQSVNTRATDEVVAQAIAHMGQTSTLPRLLDRFLTRADRLPPHPVAAGDNELRALTTIRDLLEVGRKYRNCLASKRGHVAAGKLAFAEFRGECILEFRRLSAGKGWLLWEMHGHQNKHVAVAICDAAAARCEDLGIPRPDESAGSPHWRSYKRFARELEWGWAA